MSRVHSIVPLLFLLVAEPARADEPFRFPEAKHARGDLRYIQGVPVLVVAGTPEEIGEQVGILGIKPAAPALALVKDLLHAQGVGRLEPLLTRLGEGLLTKFPDAYRREIDSSAKASGTPRELLILGNTLHDIRRLSGCSTLLVEPARSSTGKALVGRNLDFPFIKGMHQYTLVTVCRAQGKRAFAAVSFPGANVVGCAMSAINADGLVFGQNDVGRAADNSRSIELGNTPTAVLSRQVLEECATVADVEAFLKRSKAAGRSIFFACDRNGGAVFEVTPNSVVIRRGDAGICEATNHFQSKELSIGETCQRGAMLARARRLNKLGVAEVADKMAAVNLGWRTAHSMVFEPATLTLHLAIGDGERPASDFPLRRLPLKELLRP
jgi:hypothetical protein